MRTKGLQVEGLSIFHPLIKIRSTSMAVVTLYMSDRDKNQTFSDKKAADNYDKMLELAENVSLWLEQSIQGLSEQQVEDIGLLVAQNKDKLAQAIKNHPEKLLQKEAEEPTKISDSKASRKTESVDKVTKLSA